MKSENRKGFTLAEMLVICGIAAVVIFTAGSGLAQMAVRVDNSTKTIIEPTNSVFWASNAPGITNALSGNYATAAQGLLANTALQPGASWTNISGLGTAATNASSAFATASQGALAASALQPGASWINISGLGTAATNAAAAFAYAAQTIGAPVYQSTPSKIVIGGDSMSAGGVGTWSINLAALMWPGVTVVNTAVSGNTVQTQIDNYAANVRPHAPTGGQVSYYVVLCGVNDLYSFDPETVYYRLKTLWALAVADGFRVIAVTLPDNSFISGFNSALQKRWRVALNSMIRSDPSLYYGLIPADDWLTNAADTTYYNVDQLHLNSAGNTLLANNAHRRISNIDFNPPSQAAQLGQSVNNVLPASLAMSGVNEWSIALPFYGSSVNGTSSISSSLGRLVLTTEAAAGKHASALFVWPTYDSNNRIFWHANCGVALVVSGTLALPNNEDGRLIVAVGDAANSGNLSNSGMSCEFRRYADYKYKVRCSGYTGGVLTDSAWATTGTSNYHVRVVLLNYNGTVSVWVQSTDGRLFDQAVPLATTSGGPTSRAASGSGNQIRITVESGSSASAATFYINEIKAFQSGVISTVPPNR